MKNFEAKVVSGRTPEQTPKVSHHERVARWSLIYHTHCSCVVTVNVDYLITQERSPSFQSKHNTQSLLVVDVQTCQSRGINPQVRIKPILLKHCSNTRWTGICVDVSNRPSVVERTLTIENFKKNQAELFGRYDSGFFGYRGLQGDIYCVVKSRRNLEDDIEKCSVPAKRMILLHY